MTSTHKTIGVGFTWFIWRCPNVCARFPISQRFFPWGWTKMQSGIQWWYFSFQIGTPSSWWCSDGWWNCVPALFVGWLSEPFKGLWYLGHQQVTDWNTWWMIIHRCTPLIIQSLGFNPCITSQCVLARFDHGRGHGVCRRHSYTWILGWCVSLMESHAKCESLYPLQPNSHTWCFFKLAMIKV